MTQAWRIEDLAQKSGPGIPIPTPEGQWLENYQQELEIRPVTHQPVLSEEPTSLEGILEPTTFLFLADKGKRGSQPWAGTRIRAGGTMRGMLMTNLEAKDTLRRMMPSGEVVTRKEGTGDHHGPMKTSSSGVVPTRNLQNSHSRQRNWATSS